MKTEIRIGEKVIKEGFANLQRNIETVGGKLFLTNQRLIFEAHKVNIQRGTTEIELQDVQSTCPCVMFGPLQYWHKQLALVNDLEIPQLFL